MNDLSGDGNGTGTVGKAMAVLDQVAAHQKPVRFAELLDASPYPKATLYRMLQTLTQEGMLDHDTETGTYAPGLRLVRLAHSAWRQSSLALLARPHIDALSRRVDETIHLAQLERGQVLYLDKRNARHPIEMFSEAGKVGPGYCTGVGKAMIAHLPEPERSEMIPLQAFHAYTSQTITTPEAFVAGLETIRRDGFAYDREEHEPGIICIAAPILSRTGRVMGALSITTSKHRTSLNALEGFRPALAETAAHIAETAATWQFPD